MTVMGFSLGVVPQAALSFARSNRLKIAFFCLRGWHSADTGKPASCGISLFLTVYLASVAWQTIVATCGDRR